MSDPTVIAFLTKLLCKHGGRLPREMLPQFLQLPPEQIEQVLRDEPHKFTQVADLVLARNAVRICPKYLKSEEEEEGECGKLHLCRHYLQGKCRRNKRPQCPFSHNILSDHNQKVLKDNEISGLNDEELKVLLLQNDNQLLPEVCMKYLHDKCDLGKGCTRLHICGYFTRGECNRRMCKRSHDLLEFGADLSVRCRMPEVSVQNFQMLCTVKHNEHLQSLIGAGNNWQPAAWRGRGRQRGANRKYPNSRDVSEHRSRGRQEERAGANNRVRSSSRPILNICLSGGDEDDDEPQKSRLDRIMDDWFNEYNPAAKSSPMFQPLGTVSTSYVGEFCSSGIQSALLGASPKVSSKPGISDDILLPSIPSVPQPRPSTTPETTAKPVDAPSVNVPMGGPPFATYGKPMSSPAVNPSTGPPRRPSRLIDPLPNGPSVPQEKSGTIPTASLYSATPVTTNKPVTSPSASLSGAQPESQTRLAYACMRSPSVPDEKSVTTSVATLYIAPPVVTTNKPAASSTASPSVAPPESQTRLAYACMRSPSVPDDKPVTTDVASLYRATPVVITSKPVASSTASPSRAPPVSQTRLDYSSMSSTVPQEKPVHPNVWSQLVPDYKPPYSDLTDKTSVYGATSTLPKSPEPDAVPDICLSNVWKYCKFGKCCPDMHYYLPYCWQIHKGTGWEDISDMEQVEKQYCNPNLDRVPLINFLTMRSGMHRVRRLSTVSSVVKPLEYVLTTEWLWYWKDEYGTWTQYGHSNVKQVSSNLFSSDLENVYLSDPTTAIDFGAGNQRYEIRFREMKQKNLTYMTEKDVRRRPKFLSFEDVKLLKGSTKSAATSPLKSGTSPLKTDIYPRTWEAGAMPEIGCQKVPVSDTSSEFSEIVSSFTNTVSGHKVKKMWRLQNPSLWQVFQWQKEQMKKVHLGRDVKEIRLFHGTEKMHIDAICNQNFDWRICGTHGTVYGQGSYFARDASYSHNYSTPTLSGTRTMFVARVLVGDYVVGNPQMKRPPQRPGSSTRYFDSCVDNTISPSIYVVFEKYQIYPEYLLEYEEEQKKSCAVC